MLLHCICIVDVSDVYRKSRLNQKKATRRLSVTRSSENSLIVIGSSVTLTTSRFSYAKTDSSNKHRLAIRVSGYIQGEAMNHWKFAFREFVMDRLRCKLQTRCFVKSMTEQKIIEHPRVEATLCRLSKAKIVMTFWYKCVVAFPR